MSRTWAVEAMRVLAQNKSAQVRLPGFPYVRPDWKGQSATVLPIHRAPAKSGLG